MNWLKSLFSKDMLPLDEEDAPKGVITAKGTMSYEDFAKKELTEYHQHGTVSDLMAVIGLGGKASRDWSSGAAETFALEQTWNTPTGVVRENFGNLGTVEPLTEKEIARSARAFKRAFKTPAISSADMNTNELIHSQTVKGILPSFFN
jgi:hypothetical protein